MNDKEEPWGKLRCPHCGVRDSKTIPMKGILRDLYYRECQNCGILFNPEIAQKFYNENPEEFKD